MNGQHGEAADLLREILLTKKSEYWVWAEAARLYKAVDQSLAVACYCQALLTKADEKYLGKIHIELAETLANGEAYELASQELGIAASIYKKQGWKVPAEAVALSSSTWYNPSPVCAKPADFYRSHSGKALGLCYERVESKAASFLGYTSGHGGKQQLPLFAIDIFSQSDQYIGRRRYRLTDQLERGAPVVVLAGIEGGSVDILDVTTRDDGEKWDCCDHIVGSTVPDEFEIGKTSGHLRRSASGFGFVQNVFIPPHLLSSIAPGATSLMVVAVGRLDKKKNRMGWQAIYAEEIA